MVSLIPDYLAEEASLRRILSRLKREADRPQDQLLYVGVHNLAQFWWCAMFAVFKSKEREWQFLRSVLFDAWRYTAVLQKVTHMPRSAAELLRVLQDVPQKEIEKLWLSADGPPDIPLLPLPSLTLADFLDPEDDDEIGDPSAEFAERYPTYRWYLRRGGYILVGAPDGIGKDFVYEFKSAASESMFRRVARPVGRTQADLYGLMYRRPNKRLQVYVRDGGELHTLDEPVDRQRVQETLKKFRAVDKTGSARPPQPWKCGNCDYREICSIRPAA